jgi:predicted nucleic acid-binding protein
VTLYVDSSALLKRYVEEPGSDAADAALRSDPALVTGRHTIVEVRRNLARLLSGRELAWAQRAFQGDLASISLVELDPTTCEDAAVVAETTGVRTLDALHLAAARRVGGTELPLLTYDVRQAQAARSLGLTAIGA